MNRPFRKARTGPVLSQEEGARQGRVVRAAQAALLEREAVLLFLNSHHPALGGRPLDLAVGSAAGLHAVEMSLQSGGAR